MVPYIIVFFLIVIIVSIILLYFNENDDTIANKNVKPRGGSHKYVSGDKPFTLIVIVGLQRSFDTCLDRLVENMILPNEPCHILVAMDEKDGYSNKMLTVLGKWLLPRPKPYDVKPFLGRDLKTAHVEFQHSYHALQGLGNAVNDYEYMIITRTDVFLNSRVSLSILYGDNSIGFAKSYKLFKQELTAHGKNMTNKDILYYWIAGGGVSLYAKLRYDNPNDLLMWCPPSIQWCNITETLKPIHQQISSFTDSQLVAEPLRCLRRVVNKQKLFFIMGPTWIRFGKTKYMMENVNDMEHNYRIFQEHTMDHNNTESHLRLSIKHCGGVNVDMINGADSSPVFGGDKRKLNELSKDKNIGHFILRDFHI